MPNPLIDVFEHGIVAFASPPTGLARLATTRSEPVYSGYTLSLVDADGSSLNRRVDELVRVPFPHRTADFWDERDVVYCLSSCLYHLNRIIDLYVEVCRLFEERHPEVTYGNTNDPRIYYEIDAFLGAARRVYEAIRVVLWKYYGAPQKGAGSRWRSITTVVKDKSGVIPTQFFELLQQSWEARGERLSEYRDCMSHYVPLTANTAVWMNGYDGRWGAIVPLPSNPSARSRAGFDNLGQPDPWDSAVDALSYCHGVAAHLVGLCEAMMALPEIASRIANPPR